MPDRILVSVDDIIGYGGKDGYSTVRALWDLADEINSALPGLECTFVHLDTGNFLVFAGSNVEEEVE